MVVSQDESMAGLHQIEADIRLCERFLNMDAGGLMEQEASGVPVPAGGVRDGDRGQARAEGGDGAKLSQQRRKEILDRLLAERRASKQGATVSASAIQTRPGQSARREASTGGGVNGETREQLIQRLIAEKRDREARNDGDDTPQRAYLTAAPAAKQVPPDPRSMRQAWAERESPDTDSLDNDALRSGQGAPKGAQYHTDAQSAAAQRRPRPASAPRQRMTAGGRVLGAQNSTDSSERSSRDDRPPHSARSGSVPRERSAPTRPRSPNFSKVPNMHSKDRIVQQIEAEMRENLTFKPKISQYKEGELRHGGDRVEYLAQSKKAVWEARERAKLQREEEEQKSMCSFKPKIVSKSRGSPSKVPVEVRLLHTANNKLALRQRAKRHLEEQELIATCNGNTFRPKINQASRLLDRNSRPLHERVGQVQRDRQQKRHEAQLKLEAQNADLTFKPAINDKSLRIAERVYSEMRVSGDLAERLQAQQHMSVDARLRKQAAIDMERAQKQSFQPQINKNSEKILEHSEKFAGKNFFDRQAETLERKLRAPTVLVEHSFQPDIGKAASLLPEELAHETSQERLERLAYRDKDHILSSRETIKEQYYSQFNFKPEINPISKVLGQAHSVEELHRDTARKERFEMLVRAKEQALDQECTFKPKVSQTYTRATGYGDASFNSHNGLSQASFNMERSRYSIDVTQPDTLTQRIKEKERQKMAQCEQVKKKKEYEELKECTFTPAIKRAVPKQASGPIVVRGLGRHLELKELAQRQSEEKAERERKVFLTHVTNASTKPYTVPHPFDLSSYDKKHEDKKEKLRKAVESIAMAECTFQPQTNEGNVRKLLQSILDQDPSALNNMR